MGCPIVLAIRRCMGIVSFFLVLRRFIRAMVGAWRRDEEFRSLVYLVLITLAGGTLFTVLYTFVGVGLIAGFINSLAKETFARGRRGGGEGQRGAPSS